VLRNCQLIVFGRRIHHGEIGVILAAIGTLAVLDDIRDRRSWFRRVVA
jgi:hypothetical protein